MTSLARFVSRLCFVSLRIFWFVSLRAVRSPKNYSIARARGSAQLQHMRILTSGWWSVTRARNFPCHARPEGGAWMRERDDRGEAPDPHCGGRRRSRESGRETEGIAGLPFVAAGGRRGFPRTDHSVSTPTVVVLLTCA